MDAASSAAPGGRPDGHLSHGGRLPRSEMTNGRDERPRHRSRSRSRRRRGRDRSRDRSRSRRERCRDDDHRRRDRDRRDSYDRRDRDDSRRRDGDEDRRGRDRRDDGRRRDRSGGTQRPQRLRPNASSFGAFLKGVVRERERADDELRRAADKQLARIEFGE